MISPEKMIELFVHRKDVFAEQTKSGSYFPIKRPITKTDIIEHLNGVNTYGVYCLDVDNSVKWVCVDLDLKIKCEKCGVDVSYVFVNTYYCSNCGVKVVSREAENLWNKARSVFYEFKEFDRRFLEWSGRKGYHIWLFFDKTVPAIYARQLVMSRLNKINVLGVEVFPKQIELNTGRLYGNLVKLPFAIHKVSGQRSIILLSVGDFE